jgi:hypothetical protein
VTVVGLLAMGVSQTHSQEKTAGGIAAPAPDAIAAAKKEFEGIKSARDAALTPKAGLPRASVPELSMPSASPNIGATQKKIGPEAKSPNWLIEAMEKPERERDLRGKSSGSRDRQRSSDSREERSARTDEAARASVRADDDGEANARAVFNPLTQYLGDWMTPQDYALLRPGLAVDAGIDLKSVTGFGPLDTVGSVPGAIGLKGGELDLRTSTTTLSAPRENPFLQALSPDVGVTSIPGSTKPVALPPSRSPQPATIAPPPPLPSAQSKIPDFARPPTDERYFKQLKRF